MEIPTKNLDERLDNLAERLSVSQHPSRIKTILDAREVIKAQALEIVELQAVIVRQRDEIGAMGEELDSENAIIIKLENNLLTN
jgi:hypothetical protein